MKIRNGFISNSSSSSFIVNVSDIFMIPPMSPNLKDKKTFKIPRSFGGEYEFGRQRDNYTDFGSRLNWAYLQAWSVEKFWDLYNADPDSFKNWDQKHLQRQLEFAKKHHEDLESLKNVILKNYPQVDNILIEFKDSYYTSEDGSGGYDENAFHGYIDHQSKWNESDATKEMYDSIFETEETIFQWLFGVDNMIINRSDEYNDSCEIEVDHRYDYTGWDDEKDYEDEEEEKVYE